MTEGETRFFVGGTGTRVGMLGTSWNSGLDVPPSFVYDMLPYTSKSKLDERVKRLIWVSSKNSFGATSHSLLDQLTGEASVSGNFKILALRRKAADEERPTGTSGILVTLRAQAKSHAYPGGELMNAYIILPPDVLYNVTVEVQAGDKSQSDSNGLTGLVDREVEAKQLLTLNWDSASLCEGESDIYAIEVSTDSVSARSNGTLGNTSAQFHAVASAQPQTDDRSVTLSRAGATGEWMDDQGVTHGDTTYSYMYPAPLIRPNGAPDQQLHENWQWINASIGGTWGPYSETSYSWTPAGTHPFYVDFPTRSRQLMPTGQLSMDANDKWQGTSGADSYTEIPITYEITDSDGAKATAVYNLRVHEPVEKISSETDGVTNVVDFFDLNGEPHIENELTATHTESQSWSITGSIGTEMFGIPLGIEAGTENSTGYEVSKTLAAYSGQLGPGEYVNAKKRLNYNRYHVLFYKYNENGKEKRYMSPPGPGQPDPGVPIEVPHEAIWTRFSNWKLSWSEVKRADAGGYPTAATPQPTLPPPSFKYSKLEGKKNENPVL